jgi:hypothetical protein
VTQLQPTDEMLAAYERAWLGTDGGHEVDIRAGLAAVLAIVERGQDAREAQCGNCGHLVLPDGSCACSWPIDAARANARPATEPTEEP